MTGKFIIYGILFIFISSCDMYTGTSGKVIDQETGKPISDARVVLLDKLDSTKTNNKGYFEIRKSTGAYKVDPEVLITKAGYKPFQLKKKYTSKETSYIVKSELIYVDFDKPVYPDPKNRKTFLVCTSIEKWSQDFRTGDTLIFYLTRDDRKSEIENIKSEIKNK